MNLALSDEQEFLREAARGTLSRFKTVEAAREALDGNQGALPDLWPTACEAGWPGLLIGEAHGGAGLDAFDAMLVMGECGRVLAGVALLGHLPATAILDDGARGRVSPSSWPTWPAASGAPPTCPRSRPAISTSAGAPIRPAASRAAICRSPGPRAKTVA